MADQAIYEVMYPYCRVGLVTVVSNAMAGMERCEILYARILEQFVPARQLTQLRNETHEKVQSEGKSLASYMQSMGNAAFVFRIREDEAHVGGTYTHSICQLCFRLLFRLFALGTSYSTGSQHFVR
jgi:hypothetical protein